LHIFRHLAHKSLDIRQYACKISIQSDEKSVGASLAQSLCGVAYISILKELKSHYPESPSKTIMVFYIKVNVAVENGSKNR